MLTLLNGACIYGKQYILTSLYLVWPIVNRNLDLLYLEHNNHYTTEAVFKGNNNVKIKLCVLKYITIQPENHHYPKHSAVPSWQTF